MLAAIAVAVAVTLVPLLRRDGIGSDDGFDEYFRGGYD